MPLPELYEYKVVNDGELPIQLLVDRFTEPKLVTKNHWHEHVELHCIVRGGADFLVGDKHLHVATGDILIINSNELHGGVCTQAPYLGNVIIFDMGELSEELSKKNFIFRNLIRDDKTLHSLIVRLFAELEQKQVGYKQLCRALSLELLVYLCRNYVVQTLPEKDSDRRKKNLERLNAVIRYIEDFYNQPITVKQLADMMHLSVDRFGHLFQENVGKAPLQYLNEARLRKAVSLLKAKQLSVTEVANEVGFHDYNHFGRLFRKRYGCTPNAVRQGKVHPNVDKPAAE